jgi:thymidylate synthase ThyX
MFPYAEEGFSNEEADVLRRYVTNLDRPVFALVNLPEVVKGALFARYSRSAKSLRRLFLDEFVGDLDVSGDMSLDATVGLRRAEELYERVFGEYGDDSVAQLGGVHLACEQVSNVLSKVIERSRLMSYLEQSTRYVPYDSRLATGHYRYFRDQAVLDSPLGARYVGEMDGMFDTYAALLPEMQAWLSRRYARPEGTSEVAYRRSVRAKALDVLRGLLPAGSLSNVGVYGSGQAYEMLLLRLASHPLPEARDYGDMMLEELRKVIPSFLQRIDRRDRGGVWRDYLSERRRATAEIVERLWPGAKSEYGDRGASVKLTDYDPDGEEKVAAAIIFEAGGCSDQESLVRARSLSFEDKAALFRAYVGERSNRRHRPGRAFERTSYRFEVVSDYGAFRDLQRHRMLTVEWQELSPDLGFELPLEVEEAGLASRFVESLERSASLYEAMRERFASQAPYAVALAYRVRYVMEMNAREAMHVLELRSGEQGHPSYRRVAQEMHRLVEEVAGHRLIARSMVHVDHAPYDLGRMGAETRAEARSDRVGHDPGSIRPEKVDQSS